MIEKSNVNESWKELKKKESEKNENSMWISVDAKAATYLLYNGLTS